MKIIFMLATLLLLVSCSSTPVSTSGEPPVRYARYVKVAIYDSTSRPATDKLTVIRETPTRKYHTIATLTIDGTAEKEGELVNALAWKARQMGADSILILTPLHPHRDEWIFQADAIVMDADK
jgi:hypothetical protein